MLRPSLDDDAIRYAMLSAVVAAIAAAVCCFAIGHHLETGRLRAIPDGKTGMVGTGTPFG